MRSAQKQQNAAISEAQRVQTAECCNLFIAVGQSPPNNPSLRVSKTAECRYFFNAVCQNLQIAVSPPKQYAQEI